MVEGETWVVGPRIRARGPRHRPSVDAGFSLVEMLVATAILASGLVALAGLSLIATTTTERARRLTMSVALASQKLEQLRALAWSYDTLGLLLTDESSDLSVTPPSAAGGRGLLPSPAGSLSSSLPGYVDYLDRGGNWVGTGASVVPGAAYVRRWAVEPLPDDPANIVVLTVVVEDAGRRRSETAGRPPPSTFDVSIVSVKARKYG